MSNINQSAQIDDVLKIDGRSNINNPFNTVNTINTGYIGNGPPSLDDKVILYSLSELKGNMYAMSEGNYTSTAFIDKLSPDNVFSLSIPPETSIKLFCGDIYDYGGKGAVQFTNVTTDRISVLTLPQNVQGNVRSIIISSRKNSDTFASAQSVDVPTLTDHPLELFNSDILNSNVLNSNVLNSNILNSNILNSNIQSNIQSNSNALDYIIIYLYWLGIIIILFSIIKNNKDKILYWL